VWEELSWQSNTLSHYLSDGEKVCGRPAATVRNSTIEMGYESRLRSIFDFGLSRMRQMDLNTKRAHQLEHAR